MKRPVSLCAPKETLEQQLTAMKTARQEIEMLKDELFRTKTTVRLMQEDQVTVQAMEEKIKQAGNVELLYPVMTDQTKEIGILKQEIRHLQAAVEDIEMRASLEYQHTRGIEMSVQKLADASTAHPPVNVREEIELFTDERYSQYGHHYDGIPTNNKDPIVSDPHLGS